MGQKYRERWVAKMNLWLEKKESDELNFIAEKYYWGLKSVALRKMINEKYESIKANSK